MSTTVNVRVVKNQVTDKLKQQSEANRFAEENGSGTQLTPAEQQAQQEAAARAVEAVRLSTDQASFKKRDPLRDPIGRREEGGGGPGGNNPGEPGTLPDGTPVEDGALIQLSRVGIRWNSNRTRAFVYPWGIEGALGRRLSSDYNTAKAEAFAVGTELEFSVRTPVTPPEPPRSLGEGPRWIGYEGTPYEITPLAFTYKRIPFFFDVVDGKNVFEILTGGCLENGTSDPIFDKWDFAIEQVVFSSINPGVKLACIYYAGLNEDQNFSDSYFYKSFTLRLTPTTTFGSLQDASAFNQIYELLLPVGGDKVLAVFIHRSLASGFYSRFFYEYTGSTFIADTNSTGTRIATGTTVEGGLSEDPETFIDEVILNDVQCVLVDGDSTQQVTPSSQLIAACASLVKEISAEDRTGSRTLNSQQQLSYSQTVEGVLGSPTTKITFNETFFNYTFPTFEASNLPKAPYYDIPDPQQALQKQLGLGFIESNNHAGPFSTPAIFDWLKGSATFGTSYQSVVSKYYTPANPNSAFPNVYISVPPTGADQQNLRATLTTPSDISTPLAATDWVTINTGSRFGDYLVWDWGNPEYCRQQLQQLGMGFL